MKTHNYTEHSVTIGGIVVKYRFCREWHSSTISKDYSFDHIEFLSRLVRSETGYLSHFIHSSTIDDYGGHAEYARLFCQSAIGHKADTAQADLFDCCF